MQISLEMLARQLQDLVVLIISIFYYLRLIFKAIKLREVYEVLGSIILPIKPGGGVAVLACRQLP